jgi:hypothetical protein
MLIYELVKYYTISAEQQVRRDFKILETITY